MKWNIINMQNRLYFMTAIFLLAGLGSALLIYLTAGDASENMAIYEFEHSNKYRHDLELYAGKWNILADDFSRWFGGLWHGQSLAFTIACITIAISLVVIVVAYHLPAVTDCITGDDHKQDETDYPILFIKGCVISLKYSSLPAELAFVWRTAVPL
jgi:hypothetical protein